MNSCKLSNVCAKLCDDFIGGVGVFDVFVDELYFELVLELLLLLLLQPLDVPLTNTLSLFNNSAAAAFALLFAAINAFLSIDDVAALLDVDVTPDVPPAVDDVPASKLFKMAPFVIKVDDDDVGDVPQVPFVPSNRPSPQP